MFYFFNLFDLYKEANIIICYGSIKSWKDDLLDSGNFSLLLVCCIPDLLHLF